MSALASDAVAQGDWGSCTLVITKYLVAVVIGSCDEETGNPVLFFRNYEKV